MTSKAQTEKYILHPADSSLQKIGSETKGGQMKLHSENDLVEFSKFWLFQTQNLLIIWTTKCLVDQSNYFIVLAKSEYLLDSIKKFI